MRKVLRRLTAVPIFILRHPGWMIELLLTYWLAFVIFPENRALFARVAHAAFGGARAAIALLQSDTLGTGAVLALLLVKMMPGVLPLIVLAARLRGWERLRLPLWTLLLPCIALLAWSIPWTAPRFGVLAIMAAAAIWLTQYRWLRWTVLVPLAMYPAIFTKTSYMHGLAHAHQSPSQLQSLAERCRQNDGQRPFNLHADQIGPYYYSVTLLNNETLLLTADPPSGGDRGSGDFSSWWLRRQGEGWVFDARSAVAGDLENGCLMNHEIWFNSSLPRAGGNDIIGVSQDAASGRESLRVIRLNAQCNTLGPAVCLSERRTVIVTESVSDNRIWEVSPDTGSVRPMGYEPGALLWVAKAHDGDYLTINDSSDLLVYSLKDERVSQRIPAGVFMFNRHDSCPLDDAVALADMAGRVRLFARGADGRYRFDWGISLPAPRNVAFSPDCRFLGVTSLNDTTVSLVDRVTRKVVATYHAGPALREITFLGPRELAVTDACTVTTFRF